MKRIDLNGSWEATCYRENGEVDFEFKGTVPGCVHTDLIAENIIDYDIFYRDNADKCQWIENRAFDYERSFSVSKLSDSAELVFEGLDTYAEIYLNGKHLGDTDDMFITHRFALKGFLKEGDNTLKVHFRSPIKEVEGRREYPAAFTRERIHTRRIQCTYSWDWVARFVTSGIFKDVYIQDNNNAFTVDNAYVYTVSIEGDAPQICFEAEFKNFEKGEHITAEILSPEGEVVFSHKYYVNEKELKEHVNITGGKLWYPAGYGEQPIYTLKIHDKEFKFGIRTAVIHQVKDAVGGEYYNKALSVQSSALGQIADKNKEFSGFVLHVNGIPVFCKGANWVPSEPFPSAEDDEKMTEILTLAKEANLNMLRVWGGGIFERQHFYSECDRLGIMTTQDFLMACGQYPEKESYFIEQLKKETEHAAKELRNHPSLMWWSGDNENAVRGWDDSEEYDGRTAIHLGIAPVLMKFDPMRRFMPSSPCGGEEYRSVTVGTSHHTNYLGNLLFSYINKEDMKDYKEFFEMFTSRFVAEEPTMGAINLTSLRRFMNDDDIFGSDDMWLFHTKDQGTPEVPFVKFCANFASKVLGNFKDVNDKLFKLKYCQYEWVRITMENLRRNKGYCNGEIYWMWNDCWPAAIGWSFVDYYCQPKASYYSFKRVADPVLLSVNKTDKGYEVYLTSDEFKDLAGELSLYVLSKSGLKSIEKSTVSAKGGVASVIKALDTKSIQDGEVLIAELVANGKAYRSFYKNGNLPLTSCSSVKITEQTENSITVTADNYVHAVEFEGEFVFKDNYFSLLPGESKTVAFKKAREHTSDDIVLTAYTIEL